MNCKHENEETWIRSDARGIPVGRVCKKCVAEVEARYRPEIFTDPNYYTDDTIEPEDY